MLLSQDQSLLYDQLMALTQSDDKVFYFSDQAQGDTKYRIFNYRLASYTKFLLPGALECRGIMFQLNKHNEPTRLAARPILKFFNKDENPITMDLDLSLLERVTVKSDGSLISTYMHDGLLKLKSKGSLHSIQAIDAMNWLELSNNMSFKSDLAYHTVNNHTVNLEWCSPKNRIVLSYTEAQLIVLNIRDNDTGEYLPLSDYKIGNRKFYMQDDVEFEDPTTFINSVPDMDGDIEGFVCILKDSTWFKVKTKQYLIKHKLNDSINSPRLLFEAVIRETTDDMITLFYDDQQARQKIKKMEDFARAEYNRVVDSVETYYNENQNLSRKEYAVKGLETLRKSEFGLAMCLYLDKPVDYKEHMIKCWKQYGLKDNYEETE